MWGRGGGRDPSRERGGGEPEPEAQAVGFGGTIQKLIDRAGSERTLRGLWGARLHDARAQGRSGGYSLLLGGPDPTGKPQYWAGAHGGTLTADATNRGAGGGGAWGEMREEIDGAAHTVAAVTRPWSMAPAKVEHRYRPEEKPSSRRHTKLGRSKDVGLYHLRPISFPTVVQQ